MHSLQIRMTIAFTLVIGAATLASVAVEPTSKDRRADARKAVAPPATTQAVAPRERTPSGNSERAVAGPRIQAAAGLVVARDGRVRFDPRMIDALRSGDRLSLGWRPRSAPEQFEVIRSNLPDHIDTKIHIISKIPGVSLHRMRIITGIQMLKH